MHNCNVPLSYLPRSLEPVLRRAAREFPVVILSGPRQSGKTTLLKQLFAHRYDYLSLEPPDVRAAATADPRAFLEHYRPPVIFDEVQHAPGLLPYIKEQVDGRRHSRGLYLLTGSQNLLLMEQVTESLAGRAALLRLLPLSFREIEEQPAARLPWERGVRRSAKGPSHRELWSAFLRGSYPEIALEKRRDLALWHRSYIQTYLERDVRTLRQVGDLTQFQNFLRALAARSAQLLNLTDLSRDLGVVVNTVKAWLSVLEASFQIVVLRPYYVNVGKRLVKTAKVYFTDVGTLCHLGGLRDPDHAASGPMGGAIFETAVLTEIIKTMAHRGQDPHLYFWRTSAGLEVDFIVETGGKLVPLEAKLSATPRPAMAKAIETFRRDLVGRAARGYVIHPGTVEVPLTKHASALPFRSL